jgi:hypothetical protein
VSTLERPLHDGLSSPSEDPLDLVLRLLLAQSGHENSAQRRLLLEVKRTWLRDYLTSLIERLGIALFIITNGCTKHRVNLSDMPPS